MAQKLPSNSSKKGLGRFAKTLIWVAGVVGVFYTGIFLSVIASLSRLPSKAAYPHSDSLPRANTDLAEPILQLENHTCGFLSLSAAYAKYGLSAEKENLRYRLGVDRPANPLDKTTTGTLHPDLFRVLEQDNFEYRILAPDAAGKVEILRNHFKTGNAALFLIIRENGNLHWVMSDTFAGDEFEIVDSLEESTYSVPAIPFLEFSTVSVILIQPTDRSAPRKLNPHADGLAEMAEVRSRILSRGSIQ